MKNDSKTLAQEAKWVINVYEHPSQTIYLERLIEQLEREYKALPSEFDELKERATSDFACARRDLEKDELAHVVMHIEILENGLSGRHKE